MPPALPKEAARQGCPTCWHSCRAASRRPPRSSLNRRAISRSSSLVSPSDHDFPSLHTQLLKLALQDGACDGWHMP